MCWIYNTEYLSKIKLKKYQCKYIKRCFDIIYSGFLFIFREIA